MHIDNNKIVEFTLENIPIFLKTNKETLISLNLLLDRHEINHSLVNSLNRSLLGSKTNLSEVYDEMIQNFDEVTNKVNIISKKIDEFNLNEKYEYFVDPEEILYLVFYKQIIYIQNLIENIYNYIKSNINLVFIYAYLISMLYNKPETISQNYIFILNKMIESNSFINNYDDKLKIIFDLVKINKIYLIIKIIFESDSTFLKLILDNQLNKLEELKKNNAVDISDSYNEILEESKKFKNISGISGGSEFNLKEIEEKYNKKIEYLLMGKRDIVINNIYKEEIVNMILDGPISIELWYGYNLFLYKRFKFDFKEYQNKINDQIKNKQIGDIYLISIDIFNDIKTPDVGIIQSNLVGGFSNSNYNFNYKKKYIKYKNKYLEYKYHVKK